jgi:hypothetical protein
MRCENVKSKMLNVRKHLGDLGVDEKPVLEQVLI